MKKVMKGCYLTHRPLADMHGDGVYFNRRLLKDQYSKKKNSKASRVTSSQITN